MTIVKNRGMKVEWEVKDLLSVFQLLTGETGIDAVLIDSVLFDV